MTLVSEVWGEQGERRIEKWNLNLKNWRKLYFFVECIPFHLQASVSASNRLFPSFYDYTIYILKSSLNIRIIIYIGFKINPSNERILRLFHIVVILVIYVALCVLCVLQHICVASGLEQSEYPFTPLIRPPNRTVFMWSECLFLQIYTYSEDICVSLACPYFAITKQKSFFSISIPNKIYMRKFMYYEYVNSTYPHKGL